MILLDVNDNAPEMPARISQVRLTESTVEGTIIDSSFTAPDKDDPDTLNSQVRYEILSIQPGLILFVSSQQSTDQNYFSGNIDSENPEGFEELFGIENIDTKVARIFVNKPLLGFSGTWNVEIRVSGKR